MRRLIAPASYTQGPGACADPNSFAALSGDRALLVGGDTALSVAGNDLRTGLEENGIEVGGVANGVDACTSERIDDLADTARRHDADVVVGVGGGVAIDAAKGAADAVGAELATVPTVASTDAPCSAVAVVYRDDGAFDGYVHRRRNPECVVVDTSIIAAAPTRFLRYGMGDALATHFEVEAVARADATTHAGGGPTAAARSLARRCYEIVAADGEAALDAVGRDAVTPALERVVEANTLLSGIGFESGGLAAAHAFGKGFSRAGIEAPHGRLIAFGTVAQLVLEDRDTDEVVALVRTLDLTAGLDGLGAGDDETVETIGREACRDDTTMANEPVAVTEQSAIGALRAADSLLTD